MKYDDFIHFIDRFGYAVAVNKETIASVEQTNDYSVISLINGREYEVHGNCNDLLLYLSGQKYRPYLDATEMKEDAFDSAIGVHHKYTGKTYEIDDAIKQFSFRDLAKDCYWVYSEPLESEPCALNLEYRFDL